MDWKEEKNKCYQCQNKPCVKGCPLNNDIPTFIHENDPKVAFQKLTETTVLPAICGRICQHSRQCQGSCTRGIKQEPISIGKVEAMMGDKSLQERMEIPKSIPEMIKNIEHFDSAKIVGKRVAIIGGGPAGLTAAAFLARTGISVTIYEKHEKCGGILSYGIPEFRLPQEVVEQTIQQILKIGNIDVKVKQELGKTIFLHDLLKEYDAILLSFGANISSKMKIQGEELEGVYGANEVLEHQPSINLNGQNVAVIGGGNVAMDMARTAKRNGAKSVKVIYRRAEEQMPAEKEEIEVARQEGIEFLFQNNIVKMISGTDQKNRNHVKKIECIQTTLVAKEGETRLSPVNIEGSNYYLDIDAVFMSIGSEPELKLIEKLNLAVSKYHYLQIDENYHTSKEKIFACGDIAGEKATVAWAAKSGREAAKAIVKWMMQKKQEENND